MTIGERIKRLRTNAGLTREQLADSLNLHAQTLYRYERGVRSLDTEAVRKISEWFNVTTDWLIYGKEEAEGTPLKSSEQGQKSGIEVIQSSSIDIVMVPMVEATLSAGHGSFETGDYSERKYAFRNDFLRRKGSIKDMVLMRVSGDSMTPYFEDGDVVLIDQSQKRPRPGCVFAVGVEDMVYLKIVNAEPGKVILSSHNLDYPPFEIDATEQTENSIRIIGRAIWKCREL